ncbi:unnamed protein product, partial [Meganyctiphanes norvegica]
NVVVSLLMLMALAKAEKLGDIEVITRQELVNAQLTPPLRLCIVSDQIPEAKIVSAGAPAPFSTEPPAPPPPALSYLPPSLTPLPIEERPVTVDPPVFVIETDYLPPQPLEERPVIVDPPVIEIETDYLPPQIQPSRPLPVVKPEESYGPPSVGSEVEHQPVITG